ncbi:MAG TPA: hypothetical protein VNT03_09860 [Baekduia sp.]|nr:hypothetical protein [Baekduia sp.]
MPVRPALLLCAPALAVALLAAPASQAKTYAKCPAKAGTLAKDTFGGVWHTKATLYGCTTVYGRAPRTVRLGPWKPGTKVAWDGGEAVWSVPLVRGGVRSDRIYAGSAQDGTRWLLGTRALPATANSAAGEARVQRVFAWDVTAGWVTRAGAVVFAVRSPEDEPKAIGALPAAPVADHRLVLVGAWPGADPATLAATVKIDAKDGDGDECGGSADYRLTVVPDAAAGDRVGVSWWAGWSRPFCG